MNKITFFKTFLKDRMVASVIPTSSFGVKKLCKNIDFTKDINIVEYGPGNGVFTKFLLNNITSHSRIIAIENNPDLFNYLKKIKDERLEIFHDSAINLNDILNQSKVKKIDYVISGIPFSLLSPELKITIIKNTYQALNPGGKFLVYQSSGHIKKYLKKYFRSVNSTLEIRNIPALFIFEVIK